jgi:hypothetical protein
MATQQEIQDNINLIVTGANYPANSMRPLLTSMLDFSSAGQTLVFPDLVADNTTLADTTLILEYGVNIIVTSTSTNYACRLPLPTTGKRVVVVNRSLTNISLFPSLAGGQINNYAIDAPAIIPPDGRAYDFICVENPLPGAWVWSAPATAQYDSGAITTNTLAGNNVYSAASGTLVVENGAYASFAVWGSTDGLNRPSLPLVLYSNVGTPNNYIAFKPSTGWNAITKVKVYTNLAYDINNDCQFGITAGSGYSSYNSSGTFISSTPGTTGVFGNYNVVNPYGAIDQQVPGATLSFGTLAANIGDPGTAWGELVMTTYNPNGSRVGSFYEGLDSNGNDYYFTQMVNFQIQPRQAQTGFQFCFFIEYN